MQNTKFIISYISTFCIVFFFWIRIYDIICYIYFNFKAEYMPANHEILIDFSICKIK